MRSAPDEALHALAEAFLRVPSMVDDMARRDIVEELPMQIRVSIPRSPRARTDVRAIVRTCVTRNGGLAALLTAVQRIEGDDSLDVDALHGDVITILASLLDQD
ncbi:effector-associated domain 2-containing protein [Kutzneria kofuensis]